MESDNLKNFIVTIKPDFQTSEFIESLKSHATNCMQDPFLSDILFVGILSDDMSFYRDLENEGKISIENETYGYQI